MICISFLTLRNTELDCKAVTIFPSRSYMSPKRLLQNRYLRSKIVKTPRNLTLTFRFETCLEPAIDQGSRRWKSHNMPVDGQKLVETLKKCHATMPNAQYMRTHDQDRLSLYRVRTALIVASLRFIRRVQQAAAEDKKQAHDPRIHHCTETRCTSLDQTCLLYTSPSPRD